ncbi:MAG: PilZ domain-containing protein [Desulfobacteraceae bacterium]|nr:MAG: PilZ domain-containing protein [Desulfobacteraceae bacterium]
MRLDAKKVCPACKSDTYRRVKKKWWMSIIPKAKYYQCNQCYKHFMAVYEVSSIIERRKHPRYTCDGDTPAQIRINQTEAVIQDIGSHGLCFLSQAPEWDACEKVYLELSAPVLSQNIACRFKIISKKPFLHPDHPDGMIHRVCGKYIGLNARQKNQVRMLLKGLMASDHIRLESRHEKHTYRQHPSDMNHRIEDRHPHRLNINPAVQG